MASASKEPLADSLNGNELTANSLATDSAAADSRTADSPTKDGRAKMTPPREMPAPTAVSGSVRVEIFDQVYNLRGSDADYIVKLAEYVDGKMRAVSQQTATVDSVRLAVLAALNIADEYHLLKRRLDAPTPDARQRASKLASALDEVLEDTRRTG
jgi:cell division protein ZapA